MVSQFIIGLGHQKRTGKDTLCEALLYAYRMADQDASRVAFGDSLKNVCRLLYGWAGLHNGYYYNLPECEHEREIVLPAIGKTPRQIWIEVGNKLRDVYAETWIQHALRSDHLSEVLIIPDVRYPNEAQAIKKAGGVLVKVDRPGLPEPTDVADTALSGFDGWDFQFQNTGTLEDLKSQAKLLMNAIEHQRIGIAA